MSAKVGLIMLRVVHYCYRFLCTVVTISCARLLPISVHSLYHFLCTRGFCLQQEYLRGEEVQKLCKVCASTLVKWKACSYKFRGNPEFRLLEFAGIGSSGTVHIVDFCLLFSGVCKIEKFLYFCKPTMMATKTEQNGKHIWKTTC